MASLTGITIVIDEKMRLHAVRNSLALGGAACNVGQNRNIDNMRSLAIPFYALIHILFFAAPGFAANNGASPKALIRPASAAEDSALPLSKLQAQAEAGDPASQYALGVAYGNGDGVPQNLGLALKWLRLAARNGHAKAKEDLSFMEIAGGEAAGEQKPATLPADDPHKAAPPESDDSPVTAPAMIQITTVKSEAIAMAEWRRQQKHFPDQLGQLNPAVQPFETKDKTVLFRVMGGPLEFEKARDACAAMKKIGGVCMIYRQPTPAPSR